MLCGQLAMGFAQLGLWWAAGVLQRAGALVCACAWVCIFSLSLSLIFSLFFERASVSIHDTCVAS